MLPAPSRMRRGGDFTLAVRRGRRAGSTLLAVHLATADRVSADGADGARAPVAPARVGLVVSKAVGNSVTRTRVKRRLRALAASRLDRLPAGSLAVLRATPATAKASSAVLGAELDRVLDRVLRPRGAPS